jgi:hypothetical protein
MPMADNSRFIRTIPLLLTICLLDVSAQAKTSQYIFLSEQSKLIQTGGIAGIHMTYTITGTFQLTADFDAGTALFAQVDANAVCSIPSRTGKTKHYNLDPNEAFNMTSLAGTIVAGGESIRFDGTADDGSSIQIALTFAEGSVSLKGETIPPPDSADFFIYTLEALAKSPYEYSSGSGTAEDPYQIGTVADLIGLGESPQDYDKHFILTVDVDLDPNLSGRKVFDKPVIAPVTNLDDPRSEIGFDGVFDGNGYKISHLTITGESYLGLFGKLGSGAIVTNLGLDSIDVNGTGNYIGSLAGDRSGSISASYSTGTVTGSAYVGGLVGKNWGSINTSYSTATVSGEVRVGGLMGYNSGSITTSYSTGRVTGTFIVGGLVGNNAGGGDLGNGIITESYSTGAVNGATDVGGLVGGNNQGSITMSYSTGTVTGNNIGGLVGMNWRDITTTSFWDIETSEQATSAGGTGLTTVEMQTARTFIDAGWDFVDETANGTEDIWWIDEGQGYPRLWWEPSFWEPSFWEPSFN